MKYEINLKNEDYFTVDTEEDAPAPRLERNADGFLVVHNLPDGFSVDPNQVLYINPVEDDE